MKELMERLANRVEAVSKAYNKAESQDARDRIDDFVMHGPLSFRPH